MAAACHRHFGLLRWARACAWVCKQARLPTCASGSLLSLIGMRTNAHLSICSVSGGTPGLVDTDSISRSAAASCKTDAV